MSEGPISLEINKKALRKYSTLLKPINFRAIISAASCGGCQAFEEDREDEAGWLTRDLIGARLFIVSFLCAQAENTEEGMGCAKREGEEDGWVEDMDRNAHTAPQLEQLLEPSELAPHLGQSEPCIFAVLSLKICLLTGNRILYEFLAGRWC
jgi:hypothetical protein